MKIPIVALSWISSAVAFVASPAAAQSGNISLASADSAGAAGALAADQGRISGDGSTVVFVTASALVAGDTNGLADVYAHDRRTGVTELVSVDSNGALANGASAEPAASFDGRFVAFSSAASNLVAGDTGWTDVFVRDRSSGSTRRASVDSQGKPALGPSASPDISHDGKFVAFGSGAVNLDPNDLNFLPDVFVHDMSSGKTICASLTPTGATGDSTSQSPRISGDGRYVAFLSYASNLIASDGNGTFDVFRRDLALGSTELVSQSTSGLQTSEPAGFCGISGDGRYVTFQSSDHTLTTIPFFQTQVFVRDTLLGTTEVASVNNSGRGANLGALGTTISHDGRFVAFFSPALNLVPGDTELDMDVFLRDRLLGTTREISRRRNGEPSNGTWHGTPSISADGSCIAFRSLASDLGPYDSNSVADTYVWDGVVSASRSYCTAGTSTLGCQAVLHVDSNPSASFANPCRVRAIGVEGQRSGMFVYGIDNSGFTPLAWPGSASFLCVRTPVQRTTTQDSGGTAGACDGELRFDWNAYQSAHPSSLGSPWSAGAQAFVQAWYRDPGNAARSSWSDALEFACEP